MRWIIAVTVASLCSAALANEGDLDPAFSGDGLVRVAFDVPAGTKADHALSLVLQADGKPLLMGTVDSGGQVNIGLARLLASGALDPAFNGDGDADGKIVFGTLIQVTARAMAVQSDGRIAVAARADNGASFLFRRAANGDSADFPGASFGALPFVIPGASSTDVVALIAIAGGKYMAAGSVTIGAAAADFFVARLTTDGALDSSFGSQPGYTRIAFNLDAAGSDRAVALALASDGRIAVVGTVSEVDNEFGIAMLQAGGQPDSGFDGDGRAVVNFDTGLVSNDRASSACFAPNGNLLVAGTVTDAALGEVAGLALISAGGSLVNGFGDNGRRRLAPFTSTQSGAVVCAADGKFLLTGTLNVSQPEFAPSEAFVARFLADGNNDSTFGTQGLTGFGLNRPGTPAPTGRIDRGMALALRADRGVYALFDAEYATPDYDFGVARLSGAVLFADGFE